MSDYTIDWSQTNIDGSNTVANASGSVGFTVSTPENADHDQWMIGTVSGTSGLKAWDVNDPTKVKINFDADVTNVSFDLIDVDSCSGAWDDRVTVIAKDAHGNILPVTFSGLNAAQHVNGNQLDSTSNSIGAGDAGSTVTVTIEGDVASLEIIYNNGSGADLSGVVGLGNITFDAVVVGDGYVDGTSGDDVIGADYVIDPHGDRIDSGDALLPGEASDDDVILAGAGNDFVLANTGDDEIYGGTGDDTLCGMDGDDVIYGGAGNDILEGMNNNDVLLGEAGNDTLYGDAGDDVMSGGTGDDKILGGSGKDLASGGKGDDIIKMGSGDDVAYGGVGADSILGGSGNDTLIGGNMSYDGTQDFNDLAAGELVDGQYIGDGVTITSGDPKNPVMAFDTANPTGGDNDLATGNLGTVLILSEDRDGSDPDDNGSGGSFFINFENPASVSALTLLDVDGGASVKYYDMDGNLLQQIDVSTPDNGQTVVETDLNDVAQIEVILGNSGAIDNLTYAINPDNMDGNDVIDGGDGDDYIEGNAGDDVLTGGEGEDDIFGGDGSDTIFGGAGDAVDGGATGSDNDVLDLTGQGPFYLEDVVSDMTTGGNDNGINGTVIFVDADGVPTGETLTFTDIEQIIGDEINRAPDAQDDTAETDEDTPVTIDVLGNDNDPDGDPLEVTDATSPNGDVVINEDGTITFTPDEDFTGEAEITYTITDPDGNEDTATVTVAVAPINDAPDAVDDADVTDFNTSVTVNLLANDTDVDGDDLTVLTATVPATQGTLVNNNNGTVTFTPALGFTGVATISYAIEDEEGLTDSAIHTITVANGILDGTVEGTSGDDLIDGGYVGDPDGDMVDNDDAILPGDVGDDDLIFGFGGDDTILAGAGDDEVYGGIGDDSIDGDEGNDTIFGGDGEDVIGGGQDDDTIFGGDDNDMIFGGSGDDVIDAGDGDDKVEGGSGDDTIIGGEGNDDLWGASGDDSIDGGTGNDTIATGDGNDIVEGGEGNDTIDTSGHAPLPDLSFGDIIPADGETFTLPDGTVITTSPFDDLDTVFGGAGDDTITTGDDADFIDGGIGNDVIDGGIDADEIIGGDGDDTIIGGEGSDSISGGEGNDTIFAGVAPGTNQFGIPEQIDDDLGDPEPDNGDDLVFGGAGNDTIFGADDSDVLYGDEGDDVIDGEIDDDTLFGGDGNDELTGGAGEDDIFGGQGNDTFIGGNGGDVVVGGEDPDADGDGNSDDVDVLDLTGSGVDFITYVDGDPEAGTVTFLDGSTMTFSEIENVVPCFTPGTTIATPKGERLVEELREGDRIITRDNGIQEIRWTGRKEMTGKSLVANPHLKPILIRAGALGNGLPERDMLVSPNHRVLVASEKTQLYFEESEVLAAAKHLVGSKGIHAIDVMGTAYIHFMFDRHEVVLSNGAWTESFQPGDYSLKGIGNSQRNEIFELFPELQSKTGLGAYQSARRALKKHEAKLLVK